VRRYLWTIALGSLLAGPAPADVFYDSGDVPVAKDGSLYFGFGAAAYHFNAPERHNVGTLYNDDDPTITRNDIFDFDPDEITPLWGLTMGYVLAPGAQALGSNTRVELTGHYFGFSDTKSRRPVPPDYTDFLAIDGTGHVDDPVGPDDPFDAEFRVEYDYLDAGVLVRTDFELGAGVVLSPSVGLAVSMIDEHHSLQFFDPADSEEFNRIREDVETWSGGPTLGSQLRVPLFFGLSLRLGGTAWLAYAHSEYDAGQVFFPGDPATGVANADNVRSGFGFRGTGSASLAWEAGPVVLAVTGGVDYWDRVPEIVHPQAPLGGIYNDVGNTSTAEIDLDDTTSYFAGITLAIRLP
jgi:hypothetical protein